jgi:hypothetical protein
MSKKEVNSGTIISFPDYWMIVVPQDDIGEYYRSVYNKENIARIKIQKPRWKAHISIIRGETPIQNIDKWQSFDNTEIDFSYENKIITGKKHIWFNIESEKATEIRKFFGLNEKLAYNIHCTLGYIEEIYNEEWFEENREKGD